MTDLLRAALLGWREYTAQGKLLALFLAVILFVGLQYGRVKRKTFVLYTIIAALACIIPVTAATLMLYQTLVFPYEEIWSMVPVTAMLGFGTVMFVKDTLPDLVHRQKTKMVMTILGLLAVLLLCGGLGAIPFDSEKYCLQRDTAEKLIWEAKKSLAEEEILLWAPREVMENIRAYDGSVSLIYGRDLWEPALRPYTDDSYAPELESMYVCMEKLAAESFYYNEKDMINGEEWKAALSTAIDRGVNCIVLPGNIQSELLRLTESAVHKKAVQADNYYLLTL